MKTVALLGSAEQTRALAPCDDLSVDMWAIGSCHDFFPRIDRLFELHQPHQVDASFWAWAPTETRPIYMQDAHPVADAEWPAIPAAVRFPKDAVLAHAGRPYFSSTIAWMIGLARLEGFERIELYGIDLSTVGEYSFERPCVEYWLGRHEGQGGEWFVPNFSFLAKSKELYGYNERTIYAPIYDASFFGHDSLILTDKETGHKAVIHGIYAW